LFLGRGSRWHRVRRGRLAGVLETHGQVEQAEQLRRYGLEPDGSIAAAPDSDANTVVTPNPRASNVAAEHTGPQ
jgi:hypothetical protein